MNEKREVEETVMPEDEKRNMDTKNWSLTSLANILSLSPDQQNRRDQVVSNSILNIYLKCWFFQPVSHIKATEALKW